MTNTSNKIIFDILHLLAEFTDSVESNVLLRKLIQLINKVIPADSCLIYIYDDKNETLTLIGSKKGKKDLIGNINMKKGEGITGWVVDHKETVVLRKQAYKDKRFKNFSELPEDKYESFLSIPIKNEVDVLGVINIQHKEIYNFTKDEIKIIESIVSIVASVFGRTVLKEKVDFLEGKLEERKLVEKAKGIIMKKEKVNESEAYKLIRTESMKKRKSMKEIANAIILLWG